MSKKILSIVICALVLSACTHTPKSIDNSLSLLATPSTTPTPSTGSSSNTIKSIEEPATMSAKTSVAQTAVLKTSKGEITLKLYPEVTPQTVANFTGKAKSKYYQNLTFHRVEDWVIQGGDPKGTGTGGGQMPTELSNVPFKLGSLGVARGGDIRVSNDSQFFICTKDCAWLTGQYTNFGEVTGGMEIAKAIEVGDKIISLTIIDDKPTKK